MTTQCERLAEARALLREWHDREIGEPGMKFCIADLIEATSAWLAHDNEERDDG